MPSSTILRALITLLVLSLLAAPVTAQPTAAETFDLIGLFQEIFSYLFPAESPSGQDNQQPAESEESPVDPLPAVGPYIDPAG